MHYYTLSPSQPATILWGGPPGLRPTHWSASSDAQKIHTRGSGADESIHPTFGCGYAAWWGRMASCAPVGNWLTRARFASFGRRVSNKPR